MVVQVTPLHRTTPTADPNVPELIGTADCCLAYDYRCPVRGGEDVCEGMFVYDADGMQGGEEGMLVSCICPCDRKPAEA
jgi:hypothetical protein